MGRKSAGKPAKPKRHRNFDKMVSAAYLTMIGHTQVQVAEAVGIADRTLRDWITHNDWKAAREEAKERWFASAEDAARRSVLRSMEAGNADLGFRFLERTDERLAPPKQRHEHSGAVGLYQAIQSLPEAEVRRLQGLPPEKRRAELRLLAAGGTDG